MKNIYPKLITVDKQQLNTEEDNKAYCTDSCPQDNDNMTNKCDIKFKKTRN